MRIDDIGVIGRNHLGQVVGGGGGINMCIHIANVEYMEAMAI